MQKSVTYLFLLISGAYIIGCSSAAYDLDEINIQYEEKTVIADTIKTLTESNEEIKENITPLITKFDFIIQIGAFINQPYFENFYSRAKSILGDGVFYEFKNNLYKIRIGKYNNRAEAMQILENVRSLGYLDAFIITVRKK